MLRTAWAGSLSAAVVCAAVSEVWAIDGAAAVLQRVQAELAEEPTAEEKPDDPQAALRTALAQFEAQRATMAPEAAGEAWVGLVEKLLAAPGGGDRDDFHVRLAARAEDSDEKPVTLDRLVRAIPGPEAWPTIAARLEALAQASGRPPLQAAGLNMLASLLKQDVQALGAAIARVSDVTRGSPQSYPIRYSMQELVELFGAVQDDPEAQIAMLEEELEQVKRGETYSLSVPDLVTLVGPARARLLLQRVLTATVQSIDIRVGDETKRLARQVAVEQIENLPRPWWSLVDGVDEDSVKLYETLAAKFIKPKPAQAAEGEEGAQDRATINPLNPLAMFGGRGVPSFDDPMNDYHHREARAWYVLGLIGQGRAEEAAAKLRGEGGEAPVSLPYDALAEMGKQGLTERVYEFLHALLREDADLPLWPTYQSVAVRSGHAKEMLALAREVAGREGLTPEQQRAVRGVLIDALLAADEVEEGVAALREEIAEGEEEATTESQVTPGGYAAYDPTSQGDERADRALSLAEIGRLMKNAEWEREGLDAAIAAMGEASEEERGSSRNSNARTLVDALHKAGRDDEAERYLVDELTRVLRKQREERAKAVSGRGYIDANDNPALPVLTQLLALYVDLGRHADAVTLLDEAPYWGGADLAAAAQKADRYFRSSDRALLTLAAQALAASGRREQAVSVAETRLLRAGGDDAAYAVLVGVLGQEAVPKLDALFARDRFEERPLIWKAHLLHQAGKLDEALATIREAIAIDPSDGEQGKGDRMRAYGVLADVLEARGDADGASLYRGAVSAIRIAEDADAFYAAGLLTRGVEMYRGALAHFADAYCIQSRLAIQLSRLGQHEAAAEHFRKAYELMPDSFGRIESHCFGCEGVFSTGEGASIAEQVFRELIQKTPEKPQVHYLYGYLLNSTGREKEALPHFERAVELDPDYLNAWENIQQLGQSMRLPLEVRDRATLNLVRLDPLGKHGSADVSGVWDLAALWRVMEANAVDRPTPPESAYPLRASAAQLERERKAQEEFLAKAGGSGPVVRAPRRVTWGGDEDGPMASPADAVARHVVVAASAALLTPQ